MKPELLKQLTTLSLHYDSDYNVPLPYIYILCYCESFCNDNHGFLEPTYMLVKNPLSKHNRLFRVLVKYERYFSIRAQTNFHIYVKLRGKY